MKFLLIFQQRFQGLSNPKKAIIIIAIAVLAFSFFQLFVNKKPQIQYQTAKAEKGTLVVSVSASGQITAANSIPITTQVSGAVKDVYVKNGDQVETGQKIAELILDQASQQKHASAWANYLAAQNVLNAAQTKMNSLQAALFVANQKFINDRGVTNPSADQKADPVYIEENATWLQAEGDYKNQALVISQAQAALTSASLALSQASSTILAPAAGIVKGLTITPGAVTALSSQANSASNTSDILGLIYQGGRPHAQVSISEIDSVNVSEGQKATMTLDAFPNLTFSGKVVGINTNGLVSSGVTTYPAVVSFDTEADRIYPNMSVTASIITKTKDNVLLVPSSAVQSKSGQSAVRVLNKGQAQEVNAEIGDSSDTQVEIISGLLGNEDVIVGTAGQARTQSGVSPFGLRGGFGQGALRGGGAGR